MMEVQSILYCPNPPESLGKALLSSAVSNCSDVEVSITIYEKCIMEVNQKKKNYLIFDFDVKYYFTLSPPQVTFEKKEERSVYKLRSDNDVYVWRQILKDKLNQRGFHEQFKPKKKIGKGNFASVYLAEKMEDGKNYAVKAFSKEAAYSEDKGKQCLIKEIEVMRAINHQYCMKLFEVFESDNSLYVVVELLEGGQLYDKIKAKYQFKPHQTQAIIYSILAGLKEMHAKKIMHRDLKPENLIFREEGSFQCVIADFGLAEFADSEQYLFVRCGTPGYVAPEVINIKDMKIKYDPICDIFSLGLIFHILLLGTSAFPGKTYNQVLAQNRASHLSFQADCYQKIDSSALNLLQKMLKKTPTERITAVEALDHPYFSKQDFQNDEMEDIATKISKKSVANLDSPLLLTSNTARKQQKALKKDSCIDFKMGKQNLFTGKVQTIAETPSGHSNSITNRLQSIMPKVSKFQSKK